MLEKEKAREVFYGLFNFIFEKLITLTMNSENQPKITRIDDKYLEASTGKTLWSQVSEPRNRHLHLKLVICNQCHLFQCL